MQDTLMTVREVAELLHVHPNTVRLWNSRGLLKAYRLGSRGDRRFSGRELENFLSRNGSQLGLSDANTTTETVE